MPSTLDISDDDTFEVVDETSVISLGTDDITVIRLGNNDITVTELDTDGVVFVGLNADDVIVVGPGADVTRSGELIIGCVSIGFDTDDSIFIADIEVGNTSVVEFDSFSPITIIITNISGYYKLIFKH